MDAARINAKIYAGRGKAAIRIGKTYNFFRPMVADDPLAFAYMTTFMALNAADNSYAKPSLYGKGVWFADFDASTAEGGDYICSPDGCDVYFLAAKQSLLPLAVVECNRRVSLTRPPVIAAGTVGAVGYSGLCDADGETEVIIGAASPWPCSILIGGRSGGKTSSLPGGSQIQPGWQILLPVTLPATVNNGDRLTDDLGRIYIVNAAEFTDMGWRINATETHI
jgi:hypothetical protein